MNSQYPAGCRQSDIDLSSNGDADSIDELDELCTLDCGHVSTLRNAEQTGGRLVCEECFLNPQQLPAVYKRRTSSRAAPTNLSKELKS